ncbi:MAG: hypothetical protein Q9170_001991, partial [Blastenia crenularia]
MSGPSGPTPLRKSGRKRQPNRKYSKTEITNLDALNSASEEETPAWQQPVVESSNDEEFDVAQLGDEEANDPEADEISSADAASDGSGIATPHEDFDDAASYASAEVVPIIEDGDLPPEGDELPSRRAKDQSYLWRRRKKLESGIHRRGIVEPSAPRANGSKGDYLYALVGNAPEDLIHMARSRDQWAQEIAVPRRPNPRGTKGMRHLFSHTEEIRTMEATEGWDWYYDHGGRQRFAEVQQSHTLSAAEGMKYIPQPSHTKRTIFMGPYGRQSRYNLSVFQSLALDQAWKYAAQVHRTGEEAEPQQPKEHKRRDGWLLNVGTGVRCLEWAPNHSGDTQYLALSTFQPKNPEQIGRLKFSPAFTPQSFPSSIQIWSFSSASAIDRESLLDPDHPPRLRMVICTDWGGAKALSWCPMPRNFREPDQENGTPIGLLAAVWSDGNVRVLDIRLDNQPPSQEEPIYKAYATAAFTAKPPSTLCTCITWLSPTDLAAGCANGYLAI